MLWKLRLCGRLRGVPSGGILRFSLFTPPFLPSDLDSSGGIELGEFAQWYLKTMQRPTAAA